jgi:hypothetical protein
MKTALLFLVAVAFFATTEAASTCELVTVDTNVCGMAKTQPTGAHGAIVMNYECVGMKVWGNFNQTYVQNYGTMTEGSAAYASYVGDKGSGYAIMTNTAIPDVQKYYFQHSNGKCESTAMMSSTATSMHVSFCYEDTLDDCVMG